VISVVLAWSLRFAPCASILFLHSIRSESRCFQVGFDQHVGFLVWVKYNKEIRKRRLGRWNLGIPILTDFSQKNYSLQGTGNLYSSKTITFFYRFRFSNDRLGKAAKYNRNRRDPSGIPDSKKFCDNRTCFSIGDEWWWISWVTRCARIKAGAISYKLKLRNSFSNPSPFPNACQMLKIVSSQRLRISTGRKSWTIHRQVFLKLVSERRTETSSILIGFYLADWQKWFTLLSQECGLNLQSGEVKTRSHISLHAYLIKMRLGISSVGSMFSLCLGRGLASGSQSAFYQRKSLHCFVSPSGRLCVIASERMDNLSSPIRVIRIIILAWSENLRHNVPPLWRKIPKSGMTDWIIS